MNQNPVVWFEIYVQDLPRARRFYETVLGVTLSPLPSPMPDLEMLAFPAEMPGNGASGTLAKMKGYPSGGGGTMVYFGCEDCGNEASRVEAAGGKIIRPKTDIGQYGHIVLASDPDGNMIGFHSMQ